MTDPTIRMRAGTAADIGWLAALEQSPDNARFLCAWSADRHGLGLADPDKRYLVFEDGAGHPRGFAILAGARRRGGAVELVRIAVDRPGHGFGKAALRRLIAHVFGELGATRLFLDVFDDNERARRAYRSLGFAEEAILPAAVRRQDGSLGTLVIMGMGGPSAPLVPKHGRWAMGTATR